METRELVILAIFAIVVVVAGLLARRLPVHPAANPHSEPAPGAGQAQAGPRRATRVDATSPQQLRRAARTTEQPGAPS